jgi:hypothetical protein
VIGTRHQALAGPGVALSTGLGYPPCHLPKRRIVTMTIQYQLNVTAGSPGTIISTDGNTGCRFLLTQVETVLFLRPDQHLYRHLAKRRTATTDGIPRLATFNPERLQRLLIDFAFSSESKTLCLGVIVSYYSQHINSTSNGCGPITHSCSDHETTPKPYSVHTHATQIKPTNGSIIHRPPLFPIYLFLPAPVPAR